MPETFSKRMLFDYRWLFILVFFIVQIVVWHCSCMLGILKCACGFGAEMLWAVVKGMVQNYMFNMDPGRSMSFVTLLKVLNLILQQLAEPIPL